MAISTGLQSFARKLQRAANEPVAVVGMACRFPGAADVEAFRRMLAAGGSGISDVPADRWDVDEYYDPNVAAPGKMCTRRGGFVEGVDSFASERFWISHAEAEGMDPQQRLLLESVWVALESAGIAPESLRGSSTGVFIGVASGDFALLSAGLRPNGAVPTGASNSVAAGRISYTFDLRGPCEVIDTACSSALVALHNACTSLRLGECDVAIVAGVNVLLDPEVSVAFSRAGFLARDGECKTFDARADGYVRSEGCGVLILRRLGDAVRERHLVRAVVRGSATNQDGLTQGLTAPNGLAQQAVVRQALASAGMDVAAVEYVEAHGTGTPLGDPMEMYALSAVFRGASTPFVGSVKTNIGHLEAASGIAGLIKTVLQLEDRKIYPHLNLRETNPNIPLRELGLRVPTELQSWEAKPGKMRVAGVSAFGFSGTNAHVVLEEAPPEDVRASADCERAEHLLQLSAPSEGELRELAQRYLDHLALHPTTDIGDFSYTANVGRARARTRAVCVASSRETSIAQLTEIAAARTPVVTVPAEQKPIGFVFMPMGRSDIASAHEAYRTFPVFRQSFDRCAALFRPLLGLDLREAMQSVAPADYPLDAAAFSIEWSLAENWRASGCTPHAVLGFGVGEFAAACVAGALTLESAVSLVAARARSNRAASTEGNAQQATVAMPRLAWISGVSGAPFEAVPSPAYFSRDSREPLPIDAGMKSMHEAGCRVFVEMGTASPRTKASLRSADPDCTLVPSLGPTTTLLRAAAQLWLEGVDIAWKQDGELLSRRRLLLPSHPVRRRRYPLPRRVPTGRNEPAAQTLTHPLLKRRLAATSPVFQFESSLHGSALGFLADHRVRDAVVYPGAAYLELVLAGAREAFGSKVVELRSVQFTAPLVIRADDRIRLQLMFVPSAKLPYAFRIASRTEQDAAWTTHVEGLIDPSRAASAAAPSIEELRASIPEEQSVEILYSRLAKAGLGYGHSFRGLTQAFEGSDADALGRLALPSALVGDAASMCLHPVLLDSAFHLFGVVARGDGNGVERAARVPSEIDSIVATAKPFVAGWAYVRARDPKTNDVSVWDEAGDVVAELKGVRLSPFELPVLASQVATEVYPLADRIRTASGEAARKLMLDFLTTEVAVILKLDPADPVDLDISLFEIGMTSIMAVELQYQIQTKLGLKLPIRSSLDMQSPDALTDFLLTSVIAHGPGAQAAMDTNGIAQGSTR